MSRRPRRNHLPAFKAKAKVALETIQGDKTLADAGRAARGTPAMARFNRFFHTMLARGVYLAPALFYEASFVSDAPAANDLATTLGAAREALAAG